MIDEQTINIPGPGNFQFSAVRIDQLEETEYTLVTIVCDISGSVVSFAADLSKCIGTIVDACKKSPNAERLLMRVLLFNQKLVEVHGFKNLADIDINDYQNLNPNGWTALYDATYDAVGATLEYSKRLTQQDFDANGAVYILTDGMNNSSSMTPASIAEKINNSMKNEEIESLITILIGLVSHSDPSYQQIKEHLEDFQRDAGLTEFVDVGKATAQRLARLANFVSQSVSSQSQALGSGAPSQSLTF